MKDSSSLDGNHIIFEDLFHNGFGITDLVSMTEEMLGKFTTNLYVTYLTFACIGCFFFSAIGNSITDGFM